MAEENLKLKPIPRSEWDFSDVAERQLESIFFEEYSLQSDVILAWVRWLLDFEAGGKWFLSLHNSRRNREDPEWEPELSNREVEEFKSLPFREPIIATAMLSNRLPAAGILRAGEGRSDILEGGNKGGRK